VQCTTGRVSNPSARAVATLHADAGLAEEIAGEGALSDRVERFAQPSRMLSRTCPFSTTQWRPVTFDPVLAGHDS
jgi:hypothetical protein